MELEKLPNKKFSYECMKLLASNQVLSETVISILTSGEQCANLFSCSSGFPILLEVSPQASEAELNDVCYDSSKRQRYYKDIFQHDGRAYVITNHWYGPNKSMPDNRTPFMEWIFARISHSGEKT